MDRLAHRSFFGGTFFAVCKQGLFRAVEILLDRGGRKEDNPRPWECVSAQ